MTILNKIRGELRHKFLTLRTSLRKIFNRSDYSRWSKEESLDSDWDSRTIQMAQLILPGTSVLEFGAAKLVLPKHLPEDCEYTPSDIADRGAGTLVCDLNQELPPLDKYDYIVFSGVLEYVNEMPKLIQKLSLHTDKILASYAILEFNPKERKIHGWVNDYSEDEFVGIFEAAGMKVTEKAKWRNQVIFEFDANSSG